MPNLPASDQYALGIVVYEWLCGSYPFANIRIEHRQTLPPLREKAPSIPQALEDVVMKALAKDPKDRFESVQVFADALEQASRLALLGQQFGSYRLISCLGGGKIGDVYLAEHTQLGTKVALKVLKNYIDAQAFQTGVRRIARLVHPNIVRIVNSG